MTNSRREFVQSLFGAAALTTLPPLLQAKSGASNYSSPINVIVPKDYNPPYGDVRSPNYPHKLSRAVLDFLEKSYRGKRVPIWRRPYETIDFEKRVTNIVYWVMKGVKMHHNIHPVDPSWIMAQMLHESYFYEFAVSSALAAGICQFVNATAREYDMLCGGDAATHLRAPFKLPGNAAQEGEYQRQRRAKRRFRRNNQPSKMLTLDELLEAVAKGNAIALKTAAQQNIAFKQELVAYDDQISAARNAYRDFLRKNIEGRDIFNRNDLEFILKFDERFTYKKPVYGMVLMIARALRARNGNILAAAAGYNAGLSRTIARGIYKPYGRVPNFDETATYISRIFVIHHEICQGLT